MNSHGNKRPEIFGCFTVLAPFSALTFCMTDE